MSIAKHRRDGDAVRSFYNRTPFPDFEITKFSSIDDILEGAGWFYRLINLYLPENVTVADIGCGTGQFSSLLASKKRSVVGFDFSVSSINKAVALRNKLNLGNLNFVQGDLLKPCFKKEAFDFVFCCGVLHHTVDPYRGFMELVDITKPNGYVVVGLYNHYGRLMLKAQKAAIRLFPKARDAVISGMVKRQLSCDCSDQLKIESWYADQYQHPLESVHSINEVLGWFADNRVEYINSFPPIELFKTIDTKIHDRFQPNPFHKGLQAQPKRRSIVHLLKELKWVVDLGGAGGYFLVIGKKGG